MEYSGLEHFIDVPIKNYSSGMYMRLGFAIAANLDPDILLLDEIFAVGDADFQQRCIATMERFMARGQDDHLRLARAVVDPRHLPAGSACSRRASWRSTASVDEGLAFYQQLVAHQATVAAPAVVDGHEPGIARDHVQR